MKLLLDECVAQDFRRLIVGHDVRTVAFQGWAGIKNGALLKLAEAEGFDALVTTDHGFQHQHNLAALPVAIVVLLAPSNDLDDLAPLVPDLNSALASLPPRRVTLVGPVA